MVAENVQNVKTRFNICKSRSTIATTVATRLHYLIAVVTVEPKIVLNRHKIFSNIKILLTMARNVRTKFLMVAAISTPKVGSDQHKIFNNVVWLVSNLCDSIVYTFKYEKQKLFAKEETDILKRRSP